MRLYERLFGEKKSIQRQLVISVLITILVLVVVSLFFTYFAVIHDLDSKLHDTQLLQEIEIKELTGIVTRNIPLLILNILIVTGILVGFTTKKMLQPIQQMAEATKEVASGNFAIELKTKRNDEIADLIDNFNKMVKELRSIEEIQKDFVDNVSHEFKTPITSIQGFAQLLQGDNITDAERKEYAGIILEESNRISNLSNKMLKLSSIQHKEMLTHKENINISEQIKKAIHLLEKKAAEKKIKFHLNLENKTFLGDEELLFQVWVNLIENAIKFSNNNDSIDINMTSDENRLKVAIKDCGIGIEDTSKVFDKFYQEDEARSQGGSGLGLAIVKRIVELSEGEILVDSKKDEGTTFTVILPLISENNKIIIE